LRTGGVLRKEKQEDNQHDEMTMSREKLLGNVEGAGGGVKDAEGRVLSRHAPRNSPRLRPGGWPAQ
jgi:hypothetical protein